MKTLYLVKSSPIAGREEDFNQWYNDIHLNEVLQIDGFKSAQRFKVTDTQVQSNQSHPYLAIYEIDNKDILSTVNNLRRATWLNMSDAIDMDNLEISIMKSITKEKLSSS